MKALDLFCGAGGASEGLNRAGFLVSGVDIKPQKRYPFFFMEADAMATDLAPAGEVYDFIWASPPCQAYSRAQRIQDNAHPDYIVELRGKLKATGLPYVIENVEGAPLIDPIVLCGAMFGLKVYRHRLFECSFPVAQPSHPGHVEPLTKMGRPVLNGNFMHVVGNFSGVQRARDSMDIQWMTRDELREAIPPAYSQYLAEQYLASRSKCCYPICVCKGKPDCQRPPHNGWPRDSNMTLARCTTPSARKRIIGLHGCVNACLPSAIEKVGSTLQRDSES